MGVPTTEFIFLPAKPSFKPEDPSSDDGRKFLELLASQKQHHRGMIWSRSVDRPEIIGIGLGMSKISDISVQIPPSGIRANRSQKWTLPRPSSP